MTITIVSADPKDIRGMQDVYVQTWLATYPNKEIGVTEDDIREHFKDAYSEETLKMRADRIKNLGPKNNIFFAKDGEKVVGVCSVVESETENRLRTIYVLPEYQGKGVGTMLWQKVQPLLNPHKDTLVACATYNTSAISFYTKVGFVDTGKRWQDEKFRFKSGAIIPEMEMVIKAQ